MTETFTIVGRAKGGRFVPAMTKSPAGLFLPASDLTAKGRSMVGYSRRGFLGMIAAAVAAVAAPKLPIPPSIKWSIPFDHYHGGLYQGMMQVSWRALVNDDLGIFSDMTERLAQAQRRSELLLVDEVLRTA
jgi:hypothetical protein